jgi:peptidoglycan/LPS O-acetylase OafA/YrhL
VSTIKYRRDIDGLRAVAVGSVVISHAQISSSFAGGYVGVDVFFVISGYLISSILFKEVTEGNFSIINFYRRRVLRIIPALLVVIVVSSIGAYLYLFPTELVEYAKSAIAAIFFVSNIFYWTQSGYFDAPAASKPLLHTWSLAIEEQFYIVFPIFLYLVHRYLRAYLRSCVIGVAAVSFGFVRAEHRWRGARSGYGVLSGAVSGLGIDAGRHRRAGPRQIGVWNRRPKPFDARRPRHDRGALFSL